MLKLSNVNLVNFGNCQIALLKGERMDIFDGPTLKYEHVLLDLRQNNGKDYRSGFCEIDGKIFCHVDSHFSNYPSFPEDCYFLVEEEKKPETDWDRFVKAQKEKEQQDRKAKRQAQTLKQMGQVEQVLDAYIQGGELAALATIKDLFIPEEERGEFSAVIGWIALNMPRFEKALDRLARELMEKGHKYRMEPANLERDRQWFKAISE